MIKIFCMFLMLFSTIIYADKFEQEASYKVCFTPDENCTDLIVNTINQAKNQVLVQAYSFTSTPIMGALIKAHKKGVDVKVILDRSQYRAQGFSSLKFLTDYHIPTYVDYQPSIAHNKVMIVDNKTVITGSFNFTRAAQERNTENVIIIRDSTLAKKYAANWKERLGESKEFKNSNSPFDRN